MTTKDKIIEKKSKIAVERHFKNMNNLEQGKETDYSYLDTCWICDKPFTFWDRISFNVSHSIIGNCHRRDCKK